MRKTAKMIAFLSLTVVLVACKNAPIPPAYSSNITKEQLLRGEFILGQKLQDGDLPDDAVLSISPDMEVFVKENLQGISSNSGKARQLSRSLFNEDKLGLEYDPQATFTAMGAYENSVANCLSFSFLYYSLAREIGLDVQFQEVHIMPQWDLSEEELYVDSKHVNIRVNAPGNRDLIVDIDAVEPERQIEFTLLDENYVVALYYSNIGADFLMSNKSRDAFRYFVKAIRLDDDNAAHWTNLGVLYRRAGYDDMAERAYFIALDLDKDDNAALSNLAHLYREAGDEERADYYSEMVKRYHSDNPYYFYSEAKDAIEGGEFKSALRNINKAIRKNKNIAIFYELKSEILMNLGESAEANRALRKAQSVSAETL